MLDSNTGAFAIVVAPGGGAIISDPVQISGWLRVRHRDGPVRGTPSNFNLIGGLEVGVPIVTVPIKIQLQSTALGLGDSCFIGSDQNPILLNPENTDLSPRTTSFTDFDFNGVPDPNGPLDSLLISGAVQGDNSFAVPGSDRVRHERVARSRWSTASPGCPSPAGSQPPGARRRLLGAGYSVRAGTGDRPPVRGLLACSFG